MKICPYCHAEIQEEARFCLYCMSSLDQKQTLESTKRKKGVPYIIGTVTVFFLICLIIAKSLNLHKSDLETNSSFQSDNIKEETTQSTDKIDSTHKQNYSSELIIQTESNIVVSSSEISDINSLVTHNSSNNNPFTENSTAASSTITSVSTATSTNNSSTSSSTNSSSSSLSGSSKPQDNNDESLNPYIKYYIAGNSATITSCDTEIEGELVIPSKINGYPVKTINSLAFSNCKKLTSITVPEGITLLSGVFNGCSALKKAEIGTLSDKSSFLFSYCTNLTEVIIKSGDIPKSAFTGCSKLSTVTIMSNISIIGEDAFNNCNKLTDVFCPSNFNEITIKDGNSALTSANWHVTSVTPK